MRQARGFTLAELLVALLITAIIFAMGYGAINQALSNREAVTRNQQRLAEIQRTMRMLVQDFSQASPRPVREPVGGAPEGAFISGRPGSGALVTLTRAGWANPAGVQRATLQRVSYGLVDGRLVRETRPMLDAVSTAPSRSQTLIQGVRSLRFRYLDDGRNWRDVWPVPQAGALSPARMLRWRPRAVEVTIDLEDWGRVVRIIEVTN